MDTYLLAVITDIHGNKEARDRIFEDISTAKEKVRRKGFGIPVKIINLGDAVGYGPDQAECLEIAMTFDINLTGNHEEMLRLLLVSPEKKEDMIRAGVSEDAIKSLELTIRELTGKQKIDGNITLPEERFSDMKRIDYKIMLAKEIIRARLANIRIDEPKLGLFTRKIPKKILERIGTEYSTHILMESEISREYLERVKRRERAIKIYDFLERIANNKEFRLKNARFVHDNPLNPGNADYLIGEKKLREIPSKNAVLLSKINKKKFPGVEYIFVGHSHAMPGIEEINGIKVVYCGGAIPRQDNPERKTGYVMIAVDDQRVSILYPPRILEYDWKTTQRKTKEKGLRDFFETRK